MLVALWWRAERRMEHSWISIRRSHMYDTNNSPKLPEVNLIHTRMCDKNGWIIDRIINCGETPSWTPWFRIHCACYCTDRPECYPWWQLVTISVIMHIIHPWWRMKYDMGAHLVHLLGMATSIMSSRRTYHIPTWHQGLCSQKLRLMAIGIPL